MTQVDVGVARNGVHVVWMQRKTKAQSVDGDHSLEQVIK